MRHLVDRGFLAGPAMTLVALLFCARANAEPERLEATVWHYNLQYVAGGMIGFPDGRSTAPDFTLTEVEVEDAIIVESFAPLLDVYERHPS